MKSTFACLTLLLLTSGALGQGPPPGGPGRPVFLDQLFMPEQVMRYQADIGLTDAQREAITEAMGQTQKKLVELQWQFEAASKKLADLLAAPTIEEGAATAQADQVMNLELQMKKTHLALLIRIKNVLNASQQAKLRDLRSKEPRGHGPPFPH